MPAEADARPRRHGVWLLAAVVAVWLGVTVTSSPGSHDAVVCDRDHVPGTDTVVMLSAAWCGYCRRARDYLHTAGITHCEYDVETSAEGRRRFAAMPVKVIPVLHIRDDTLFGFNRTEIEQALMAHGITAFDPH